MTLYMSECDVRFYIRSVPGNFMRIANNPTGTLTSFIVPVSFLFILLTFTVTDFSPPMQYMHKHISMLLFKAIILNVRLVQLVKKSK